jgi:glycosyltransferase involved in cell wall biosynthesis
VSPEFTIITVTHNSGAFLRETIESILSQSYSDFELIISDDCSTDGTWQIIEEYKDPRIKKYRNEVNLGEYANRSKAVQQASGAYTMFIDGDDRIYAHGLEVLQQYARLFPEPAMFFCREWDPRIVCPFKADPLTIYRFEYLDGGLIGGNFTNVLFKTAVLKANPFPSGIRSGDTYIQLKIAQLYPAVVIPGGLAWWRKRSNNATEDFFKDKRFMAEIFNYRLHFLGQDCPLPADEIDQAKKNLYGIYLRALLQLLGSGKFSDFYFLAKNLTIPAKYYSSFFKRPKYSYYGNISGNQPFHTPVITNNYLSKTN